MKKKTTEDYANRKTRIVTASVKKKTTEDYANRKTRIITASEKENNRGLCK